MDSEAEVKRQDGRAERRLGWRAAALAIGGLSILGWAIVLVLMRQFGS